MHEVRQHFNKRVEEEEKNTTIKLVDVKNDNHRSSQNHNIAQSRVNQRLDDDGDDLSNT